MIDSFNIFLWRPKLTCSSPTNINGVVSTTLIPNCQYYTTYGISNAAYCVKCSLGYTGVVMNDA